MKEKGIIYIFILLGMLSGCYDIECPDEIQTPYTEENLTYFPFVTGDTVWYFNESGGQQYYLTCIKETLKTDSILLPADKHCSNEEYLEVNQGKEYLFSSDLPYFQQKLSLMLLLSKGGENSLVDIFLNKEADKSNWHRFYYEREGDTLVQTSPYFSRLRYHDSLLIEGHYYKKVYSIFNGSTERSESYYYYDTIYYNKDGFLKFISSRSGYRLERLP